jgi:2'-5' RNA ligase
MRCFVAVEMDEAIQDQLESVQSLFKKLGGKVGWCTRGQMHLTLKFLGEVAEDLIPKVVEVLRVAAGTVAPFEMTVEGVGAFPPTGQPRVLWVGVQECPPLSNLHERIEEEFIPLGFPREDRDFTPHLTLARIKERIDTQAFRKVIVQQQHFFAGTQRVEKVILFSSTLKPTGAVYSQIAELNLGH